MKHKRRVNTAPTTLPEEEKRKPLTEYLILGELADRTGVPRAVIRTIFTELYALMDEELFGFGGSRQFIFPGAGFKLLLRARAAQPERQMLRPGTRADMILVPAKPASWKLAARFMRRMKEGIALMNPPQEEDF